MSDKFALYRFIAPFRSRLQSRLREERLNLDVSKFSRDILGGDQYPEIVLAVWELLREEAFVRDFRPSPDDDLIRVFGKGSEEVQDDVIEPLLHKLGLNVDGIDFTGFAFSSVATPRDVVAFIMKVAAAPNGAGKQRFLDIPG